MGVRPDIVGDDCCLYFSISLYIAECPIIYGLSDKWQSKPRDALRIT